MKYDEFYRVKSFEIIPNTADCFNKCFQTFECKYVAYDSKTSTCYFQVPAPGQYFICSNEMLCGCVKSEIVKKEA